MANKKNNQNKKTSDTSTMNGNVTVTSSVQNNQNNAQNNNPPTNSNTTAPTAASTATAATAVPAPTSSGSQPRLSSTSSSQGNPPKGQQTQQQAPLKKTQQVEVEKILLQINNTQSSQQNQGNYRSGGKDVRARDKENSFRGFRTQPHHQSTGQGGQQQNNRKKDKRENRDHSSQSHRGAYSSTHQTRPEPVKQTGYPPLPSSASTASTASVPSVTASSTISQVAHESKTVQTEPVEEKKKKTPKPPKAETEADPSPFKATDPKYMDTVLAFKEHDEWNKVELMCELLSFLTPVDLRLVGNCIEGSVRCYTNQMRPVEKTSNCGDPTASLPQFVCTPPPPVPPGMSAAEFIMHSQRINAFNSFFPIPPPGLPMPMAGAIPNIGYQEGVFHHPSQSTPSSSVKEMSSVPNGTTTGGTSTPASDADPRVSTTTSSPDAETPSSTSPSTTAPPPPPPLPPQPQQPIQSTPPVPQEPVRFLKSVRDLTSYLYILMSVCASTNRKSAAKIADYVTTVILREKTAILERIPDTLSKIDVLQDIGKIVSAMIHHPAVSVDVKILYMDLRDGLRAEIEQLFSHYYTHEIQLERKNRKPESLAVGMEDDEDEETDEEYEENERFQAGDSRFGITSTSHSSTVGSFFITRFIGKQIEKNDNSISLEIHWSDGDMTFTQRTREQLKALQHRLLDEFGQQRSEKFHIPGMSSSISSFDEENRKLSASTSTMEAPPVSGERIVPRLPREATTAQMVQYVNELSDLPARMMLSAVICEEFNGTRSRTEDLLQTSRDSSDGLIYSRWKNPRSKSPARFFQKNSVGGVEPIELPVNLPPFLYSNVSQGHLQTLYPSCCNCGGMHAFKDCDKITLLDKKVEHKLRLEPEGSTSATSSSTASGASQHHQQQPQLPNAYHHENNPMMSASHFSHHQNQHMIQNGMFHNGAQYRSGSQYENPPFLIAFPQSAPNNNNTNGGNGGNSNF